jgi:hypothetical protein
VLLLCCSGIQDDQELAADMPPQFTMRLRDRRVQMTYPVRLTCQVVGRPVPELTWSKDGNAIKQDGMSAPVIVFNPSYLEQLA